MCKRWELVRIVRLQKLNPKVFQMKRKFSRRTFLGGTAALAGSFVLGGCEKIYRTVSPADQVKNATLKSIYYPPALLGLRGDTEGVQNAAHSVALAGGKFTLPGKAEEQYDLVVIGAGISGLSAAYLYQKQRPQAKILILDNHEDFGGHAQRNEFTIDGKTLVSYAGSESFDSPKANFSDDVNALMKDLGVDYTKFEKYFQQDLYEKKWNLEKGVFFNKTAFGKDAVVRGEPETGEESAAEIIQNFPLPEADKQALIKLYTDPDDYLKGKSKSQREEYAENTSYYDFLKNTVKLPETALRYLLNISSEYWGHAINAVSVSEALRGGYPGVQNLRLPEEEDEEEPYIYHFPDGNASVARLLVRKMIPAIAPGNSMEDIVSAKFDYSKLDLPENNVRIRLKSTALMVENNAEGVAVAYLPQGDADLKQVQAKQCIFAGHSALAARIMPQLRQTQSEAMLSNVKVPILYGKVLVKNAHAFQKLGVYAVYAPDAPYCLIQLDDPVSMGDYRCPQTPDEPIIVHMVRVVTDMQGKDAREMYRNGRRKLLRQSYESLKQEMLEQLRNMYAVAGENLDEVLAGVTINRWAHGYSYERVGLWDSENRAERITERMQEPLGNIFMANSDVAWLPYMHDAIDQAFRAVREALKA